MTLTPPLIAIAEGRKPRWRSPGTPVPPKELKLHITTAKLLRDHCLPDWRWRFINAKAADAREGAIMKKMGANPGWPDFILVSPFGFAHFLELKRIGEDTHSESPQWQFQLWCSEMGIPHGLARTIDDVLSVFDEWGCLRIKRDSSCVDAR